MRSAIGPEAYGGGDLVRALERLRARLLVLSFSSDWLFPPYQSQELIDALLRAKKHVTYANIETPRGHDAFLLEIETEARLRADHVRSNESGKDCGPRGARLRLNSPRGRRN